MDGEKDYYELHELPDFDELWDESSGNVSSRAPVFDLSSRVGEIVGDEPDEDDAGGVERRRRDVRDFFKGFFAALAVMVPLCAGTLFIGFDPLGLDERAEQVSQTAPEVPISVSGGYTLLSAVTNENELLALSLVRADADDRCVSFAALPLETIALDSQRPAALEEIWQTKGLSGIEAAVEETLAVRIDGCAALKADTVSALVDTLGGFRFSLDRDIEVYAPGGLVEYSKHRGSSDFCGNDVKQLLLHAPHEAEERARLHERLFEAAYKAACDEKLSGEISRFYTEHADKAQTDISSAGIYALTRMLAAASAGGEGGFDVAALGGAYTPEGLFELGENGADELWLRFPKAA